MRRMTFGLASALTCALTLVGASAGNDPAQSATITSDAYQHSPPPTMTERGLAGLRAAHQAGHRLAATAQPEPAAARDTFTVPGGPIALALNTRTKTLYVVTIGAKIALVNAARCTRLVRSGCKVVGSIPGHGGYQFAVVDPSTDTIYALFGGLTGRGHAVKVINGARCNVGNRSDCRPVATVQVGRFPIGAALDSAAHTLYVSNNYSNSVSMINTATCNAKRRAGCRRAARAVGVGAGPNLSAFDQAAHTLYVPNDGPGGSDGNTGGGGTTVSMINTATCNASRHAGCRPVARVATVGNTPFGVTIAASTAYAWNSNSQTASLINTATCNASRLTSCHRAKRTVGVGANSGPGSSDPRTHTVYAVDTGDDTLSAINSTTCNARHPGGCPATAPAIATGQEPAGVLADPATDTVYVANVMDNTVSVFNGAACNATHRTGCRKPPVAVPVGAPGSADVDVATDTVYVANQLTGKVAVINGATCNAHHHGGCHVAATVTVGKAGITGSDAFGVAVNQATNTIYVSNDGNGAPSTVRVINGAACNATHTAGCSIAPATIDVGIFPGGIAVDQATDTVYLANIGSNTISVIDGATCNGTQQSGCGQTPPTIALTAPDFLAVNQKTGTLYATTFNSTVAVINAATCNATDTSGCGQTPATTTAGNDPQGVALDEVTDTVYVANNAGGDSPASVSVINGATCDGTDHSGCAHAPATAPAARGAFGLAVDQATDEILVAGFNDASVSILDGASCNAADTAGCGRAQAKTPAGSGPFWVALDNATGTAYVSQANDANLAVISTGH